MGKAGDLKVTKMVAEAAAKMVRECMAEMRRQGREVVCNCQRREEADYVPVQRRMKGRGIISPFYLSLIPIRFSLPPRASVIQ